MLFLLFQVDLAGVPWRELGTALGAVVVLFLILLFLIRVMPNITSTWKEVRLAEIDVRGKEAEARTAQATSFSQLSEVLNNVAVKSHQETEGIRIMQRVASDSSERMEEMVNGLVSSMDDISKRLAHVERQLTTQGKPHGTKA